MQIIILIFFVAAGIQSLYLILFLIGLSRKREKNPQPVPVSIIVCAHDEEQNLRQLIPELLAQQHPQFEVIIVNDRSNDGTYDLLLEETKKDKRLKAVHVDHLPAHATGKKFGITLGVKAASFDWILLTDADCRPAGTSWISSMTEQANDNAQFVLGSSPYRRKASFLNLFIRFETILTALQYFSFAALGNPYMGVGRNLMYRKSLFLEKKGFNQFLGVVGGDDDLFVNQHATKKNTRIQLSAQSQVLSEPKATWKSFFRQKVRHLSVGKRYRFGHRILLGIFSLTWILTWFTGVSVLIFQIGYWPVAAALFFRLILLLIAVRSIAKQTGQAFELWALPVLDFLYSFYYISTGLTALLTKKIRWRN